MRSSLYVFLVCLSLASTLVEAGSPKLTDGRDALRRTETAARDFSHFEASLRIKETALRLNLPKETVLDFFKMELQKPKGESDLQAWARLIQRSDASTDAAEVALLRSYLLLRSSNLSDSLSLREQNLLNIQEHWSPEQKKNITLVIDLANKLAAEGKYPDTETTFRVALKEYNFSIESSASVAPDFFTATPVLKQVSAWLKFYDVTGGSTDIPIHVQLRRNDSMTAEGVVMGVFKTPFGSYSNANVFFFRSPEGSGANTIIVLPNRGPGESGENGSMLHFPASPEVPGLFSKKSEPAITVKLKAKGASAVANIEVIQNSPLLLRMQIDHGSEFYKQNFPINITTRSKDVLKGEVIGPFAGYADVQVSFVRLYGGDIRVTFFVPENAPNEKGFQYSFLLNNTKVASKLIPRR